MKMMFTTGFFARNTSKMTNYHQPQTVFIYILKRANYQTFIWRQVLVGQQSIPDPEGNGWIIKNDSIAPVLMTKEACNPKD